MLNFVPPKVAPPEKLSPHLNRICLPFKELLIALSEELLSTDAPAGQPPLPATGVPEEETQVVALPAKPFDPAGS
jgi:hypothetical protein